MRKQIIAALVLLLVPLSLRAQGYSFGAVSAAGQITSTVTTGTAPLVISSTTLVSNLHAATADAAATVTGITPTSCTNQFITAISATGTGTCTTSTLAGAQHANQGTTVTVLHGNAAGNPSWTSVVSADMNITTTSCTNQFVTAISSGGVGTCTTATLAGAQFANQGTTTQLLHGNGSGNPSWAAVDLATAQVTGILPVANGGTNNAFFTVSGPASSAKTYTFPNANSTMTITVASGTSALATGAISSGACATVVTTSATGTATTDNIMADFNADPTATTGYSASANGMLTIIKYPTADNVNFKVCNNTGASITPGAVTLNWRVVR